VNINETEPSHNALSGRVYWLPTNAPAHKGNVDSYSVEWMLQGWLVGLGTVVICCCGLSLPFEMA